MSLAVVDDVAVARARVNRIRAHVEDIKSEIVAAYHARDWYTLDYESWDAYCAGEFGGGIAIPKTERGDLVLTMREAGMSYRAIESATDMSEATARRTASNDAVEPPSTITGVNGKEYAARRQATTSQFGQHPDLDPDNEPVVAEIVEWPEATETVDYRRFRDAVETILSIPNPETLHRQGPHLSHAQIEGVMNRLMVYFPLSLQIPTVQGG